MPALPIVPLPAAPGARPAPPSPAESSAAATALPDLRDGELHELLVAFYDVVMEITHELIDQLQLRVHVVQLERLIARFENEVGSVCTFLELSWNDRMREFASGARERGVATASGAQLSKGLNAGGVGEWRRYRDQLAPVLPTLERWAARFGYEPD